jgi:hypothetical protein
MKLYKIPNAPAGERFHSSKTGLKDFTEIELPKDGRAGMATFLNANEIEVGRPGHKWHDELQPPCPEHQMGYDCQHGHGPLPTPQLDELEQAELRAVAAARATTMSQQKQLTASSIVEFILDDATVAQAEAVFTALGTRFKELAHGAG